MPLSQHTCRTNVWNPIFINGFQTFLSTTAGLYDGLSTVTGRGTTI